VYCGVLKCVGQCCIVLQSAEYFYSVLQCVVACCSAFRGVAGWCSAPSILEVCCGVLQCVSECCSVLQCDEYLIARNPPTYALCTHGTLQHTATHCNTLPHTATHPNTPPHTTTHRNTLPHTTTHMHYAHTSAGKGVFWCLWI